MTGSPSSGFHSPEAGMPSFWVPPDAHGNGLPAQGWAAIADVTPERADELLRALRASGVPACSAQPTRAAGNMRIWVDPACYAQAENVLLHEFAHPERPRPTFDLRVDAPVSWLEAKQLWWFCDGAIMAISTRDHLWQARGLCARHSWLFFCAETDLKYQPLGVAVLYEDLIGRALHVLRGHRTEHAKMRALEPRATCLTCDYLSTARGISPGFAAERKQIESAARTRAWMRNGRRVWHARVCPRCLPGHAGAAGPLCREHLVQVGTHDETAAATGYLTSLRERMNTCIRSMTYDGPARTPDSDAALVEALGWFAGWRQGMRYMD